MCMAGNMAYAHYILQYCHNTGTLKEFAAQKVPQKLERTGSDMFGYETDTEVTEPL